MNSNNYLGMVAGIAAFLTVFGAWAKITHQAYADKMLTVGMWVLALCTAVFIYRLFQPPKQKK